jgi:hypothetical protein
LLSHQRQEAAVSTREIQRAELEAEGDRVAADFGLGRRRDAWSRRKRPASWGGGLILLLVVVIASAFVLPTPLPGLVFGILAAVFALLALIAVSAIAAGWESWQERLFEYDSGIALFADRAAEPTVLRWADLASLSLRVVTSYESHSLSSCVLRDSAGRTVTVEGAFGLAVDKIAARAELVLRQALAPTLIARYDAGEPVTFGHVIVDRTGISCPGDGSAKPWDAPWRDTRSIEILMYAHRLTITPRSGRARPVSLGGAPNDFLAGPVIEHAAQRAGVELSVG